MAKLIFCLTPGESLDFSLNPGITRLGRHPTNDIVINNTWISSRHAEFRRTSSAIFVRDVGSSNGTSVNGERIEERELRQGDRLAFGQLEAVYEAELEAAFPASPPGVAARRLLSAAPPPEPGPEPGPVAVPGKLPVSPPVPEAVRATVMAAPAAAINGATERREGTAERQVLLNKGTEAVAASARAMNERAAADEASRHSATCETAEGTAARLEHSGLSAPQESIAPTPGPGSVEDGKTSAPNQPVEKPDLPHNAPAAKINPWEKHETAAAAGAAICLEDQAASVHLRQETDQRQAGQEVELAALAMAPSRGAVLTGEITVLEARLEHLRRETEVAEALNSKVTDLRQQQAEAERRLDFLNDRLAGMSEAPDPNWGTVHSLARSFIKKLDLIDDLIAHLTGQPESAATLDQLSVFRSGLLDILREYSIEAYSLEPGTMIDVAARKRIQIVETLSEGGHDGTRIVRTYRPGYVCLNGDLGISTLLRKADVAVSIPLG